MRYILLALLLAGCSGATVNNEWTINSQGPVNIRVDSAQETTKTPTVTANTEASVVPQ